MCEVNDKSCAGEAPIKEDDALERIFSECDVRSTGRVSVAKLIGYMRDHMSTHGSPEILKDLRKSMSAASCDGEVTRKQYYDVSRTWLAGIRKRQHGQGNHQDGNNNIHVDHNSDSFTDDLAEPATNERPGNTPRIRTTLVLAEPAEDIHFDAAGSGSQLDARSFQGFLDLSTSTVVDTAESCEAPEPFFGDLSSVDGTYHLAVDDHPVAETAQDLRQRAQRCAVDNEHLREELQRAEDAIASLERQLIAVGRKLELANSRYERLQGEHEEHRELLAVAERDRDVFGAKNHRLERENSLLRKEIEAAEMEMRRLNADLDKANEQKEERLRMLAHCRQELIERQTLYDEARGQILQMELANDQLREKHDISTTTTDHLKVVVKELETRISELQPNQNYILHGGGLFASPSSDNGLDTEMDIFQESEKMIPCSLLDEMKAIEYSDPEVSRCVEIQNLNDTIEDQNINNSEYLDILRWATEELERGAAELTAVHKHLEIGLPPDQSPASIALSLVQAGVQVTGTEEHCSSIEDLQKFKSQIQHALAIMSLIASRKVTNADTKDATTQLDRLDSVPELPAVCNSDPGITSHANNNNIVNNNSDKLCPACRRENRSRKEAEEVLTVDEKPGVASVRSTSPLVPPLDVCLTSEVTSTPRSSPRHSSPPLSPGYFRERAIIVPIVAALDEIIRGTCTGSSGSESDAIYSPMGSRREHNPRYIYTLPSSRPSEFGGDVPRSAELPLSAIPARDARHASSQSLHTIIIDGPESESGSSGDVRKSYAWRCQESTTTDDTSDDTYGTDSNKSQPLSTKEPNCHASTPGSSGGMVSSQSNEDGGFGWTGKNTSAPETRRVELTPTAARNQVFSRNQTCEDHDPDVVEGLNLDLEKLTLRPAAPANERHVVNTSCQRQATTINAHDYPVEIIPATENQPHGKVPRRKSSVYQRSFDYYSRLEVDQKTVVRKSLNDVIVQKSPVPNRTPAPDDTSLRRRRSTSHPGRHDELDVLHSKKSTRTVETCESLADALSGSLGDTTKFSVHGDNREAEKSEQLHPQTARDSTPAELDVYSHEKSARPSFVMIGTPGGRLHDVPDKATRLPTVKPTKSEVSLGNRRTKYVISDTRSRPLPRPTPCLPSNVEIPSDVASADVAERRSDGREIPAKSRSVAREMSSEEDSSDSECARDRIDREEDAQVVELPLPPPPPSPSPSPSPSRSSPSSSAPLLPQTQVHPPLASRSVTLPPPPQQQKASLQLSTIGINSPFLFGDPLPYGRYVDHTDGRINGESEENCQRPFKNNQRLHRSLSESDSEPCRDNAKYSCTCRWNGARNGIICAEGGNADTAEDPKNRQSLGVFPSLPDARLIELGLAGPPDGFDPCERMGEDELERKYTALSIGLGTDRVTLPRRSALSLRQRDQAERNLATEVERMQRDIQALAPLCVDRESVERVERVRHQLEMISRCALRVSCTAELLGATHQERRVSRAALLADRYLQALRSRCDKLSAELAETKRILNENNIVIEENSGELIDDVVPRVRYRGVPSTNRTTMSRRRASIATISRPVTVNPLQEATKDTARQQRNSVSARMSLRRPSLGYDTQRLDIEKLDRTDSSSSSIGELREIFEQAESRRGSREENNNLIRSQSSNFSVGSCESGDSDIWASTREDSFSCQAQARDDELLTENRLSSRRTPRVFRTMQEQISRLPISWYILFVAVFFFGFYSNRFVTTRTAVPLKWWSVDEIIKKYIHVQRNMPPPL